MTWMWCIGVALSAQAYILSQASINWLSSHHFPPSHPSFTAILNWEIRSLFFCHFVWIAPCQFCWVSFIHALRGEHMFSLDPFLCFHSHYHRHQFTGHSPGHVCRTQSDWRMHLQRAYPDLFTCIDVERIYNYLMSRLQFSCPGGVFLLHALIKVLNTDSKFGSDFKRYLRLGGKDALLALVFVINWNHA